LNPATSPPANGTHRLRGVGRRPQNRDPRLSGDAQKRSPTTRSSAMTPRCVSAFCVFALIAGVGLAGEYTGRIVDFPETSPRNPKVGSIKVIINKGDKATKLDMKFADDAEITDKGERVFHKEMSGIVKKALKSKAKGLRVKIKTEGEGKGEVIKKVEILKADK
jgi:hypothetical protein